MAHLSATKCEKRCFEKSSAPGRAATHIACRNAICRDMTPKKKIASRAKACHSSESRREQQVTAKLTCSRSCSDTRYCCTCAGILLTLKPQTLSPKP